MEGKAVSLETAMTPGEGSSESAGARESPRRIGLFSATLVVASSMIGTGVFTTTGLLLQDLRSPLAVLLAWVLGGVLALCGALSYAELGAALPENGGEYRLLSRIFHPAVGFVAGWVSFIVGFSAPLAATGTAFGAYAARAVPALPPRAATLGAIGLFSVLHALRVSLGTSIHGAVTALQIVLLVIFVWAGFRAGAPGLLFDGAGSSTARALLSPAFAIALVYVSFSYSGWNAAVYVAGEVRRPDRTLPRALTLGAGLVTVLYVALNAAFLMAVPARELAGTVEVAHVAARRLFGLSGSRLLSGTIAIGLFASIGAGLMTGSRVYETMGQDYPVLRVLALRGRRTGPIIGILLQAGVAAAMALAASFDALLTYVGFTLSLSALLTVLGVFVLRRREPDLPRPFRTTGYPVTPLLAVAILAWTVVRAAAERPIALLFGLATLAAGAVLYPVVRRGDAPSHVGRRRPRPQ